MTTEIALNNPIMKIVYIMTLKIMISWWGIDSYFNIELIQIGDIENMISSYGSSGSSRSRVRSKSIVHNTYTVRIINFRSKPTPIHGLVKNLILIIHTQEVTPVDYHKQLLKNNLSSVSES